MRLRNEVAGGVYHVMARGVDRRPIFMDEKDYRRYTELLGRCVERYGWNLLCYCLMPNHVHLMVETPDTNLGRGMQWLHSQYARGFNRRHGRIGHLFETRFKSPMVTSDPAYVRLVGYIAANPVQAGLCRHAADWPWSSAAAVDAEDTPPPWIAHARLQARLEAMTGTRCYAEIVATWERGRPDVTSPALHARSARPRPSPGRGLRRAA